MSPAARARTRRAARRSTVEKKRGSAPGRWYTASPSSSPTVSSARVPPVEQLVAILDPILIEGARAKE
jgi:hypothetical protein